MKTMRRSIAALFLALTLLVPAWADGEPTARASSADAAAAAALQAGEAVSLRYALVENGKVTLSGGTGVYSRSENRALTPDILYGIGSVSKIYTTAAVMKLAEAGKLELDAPVVQYIPDFTMADERYRDITVRMLLNHSSGLMGTTSLNAFLFDDADSYATDHLLEALATQRLKADPGAYSVYCNDGFTLAEILVERVSGLDFTDFISREITSPLGLSSTFTPQDAFDRSRLARTYADKGPDALPTESIGIIGTGGIYATAEDLAQFGAGLTKLLSPESLAATAEAEYKKGLWPQDSEDSSLAYGLGWDSVACQPFARSGVQALVKGGDSLLYHAGLIVVPEYGLAAAVVSSGGSSGYNQQAAARLVIDALAERGVNIDETPQTLPAAKPASTPETLFNCAGLYGSSMNAVKIQFQEDGALKLTVPLAPKSPAQIFTYYDDGSFRDADGKISLRFVQETNGRTYIFQKAYAEIAGLGQLASADYAFEKLPENPLSDQVSAAWEARREKRYVALNEKFSSQTYALALPVTSLPVVDEAPGYLLSYQITDADHAKSIVNIPGSAGRDTLDVSLYRENDVEYASYGGMLAMDADAVETVYAGARSYCTIQDNGYARWYKVGGAAGKTMTVKPDGIGAFYVYNAAGLLVASSLTRGDTTAVLPVEGWIVFAGNPGARFHLTMSETAQQVPAPAAALPKTFRSLIPSLDDGGKI